MNCHVPWDTKVGLHLFIPPNPTFLIAIVVVDLFFGFFFLQNVNMSFISGEHNKFKVYQTFPEVGKLSQKVKLLFSKTKLLQSTQPNQMLS